MKTMKLSRKMIDELVALAELAAIIRFDEREADDADAELLMNCQSYFEDRKESRK